MKRVRCPKCDSYITFDETRYEPGQKLVFKCTDCSKTFAIRLGTQKVRETTSHEISDHQDKNENLGHIVVVENVFHYRQELALHMGDNVFGRYVHGTEINQPIETVDPSIDTRHCIIRVQHNKRGELEYLLRDAPSNTGTFCMNTILKDKETLPLEDGSIITIGATTLILKLSD